MTVGFTEEPLSSIEMRAMSRLARSWAEAPHFHLTRDCNARSLLTIKEQAAAVSDPAPSITSLLIWILGRTLAGHARLNAQYGDRTRRLMSQVNICVAVATARGLVAPVIRDADTSSLSTISAELTRVIQAAKDGRLTVDDVSGGTFTLTNLGMYDVDYVAPVINPPQAAILGIGRIRSVVVAVDDKPRVVPTLGLTLAVDHRVADGAAAATFLAAFALAVENPTDGLSL